ncbi:Uncharacterized protein Adt_11033 [Abeliophyllum distichum]|uniref:Uncharacterized protein n=1 Tax=Abeliophyllum distichum TaxID=126358 RepID=A0ABD1ULQ4_9LAMI
MILPHLQRTLTIVDSFWTHDWADYSVKSSDGVKLSTIKTLVARSLVLIEEAKSSGILNKSKREIRLLTDERDKLKTDLATTESDVAMFSKMSDLANQAQEVTVQALAEANKLRSEIDELDGENLKLKLETEEAVKVGVEEFKNQFEFTPYYENLQAFFVNFGARQVLAKVKELHLNLDLSVIETDYQALEEAEDGANQLPTDGTGDSAEQPPAEGA